MSSEKKKIGSRITFSRNPESASISINQRVKAWQEAVIFSWVVVWLICGFFFLSTYFISEDEKQQIFIIIFMGFWSFLLYKAIKILLWRLIGTEEVLIEKGKFHYKRAYSGIGKIKTYDLNEIENYGLIRYSAKSFKNSYESYFWSIGAETIGFNTKKKHALLGMQLNKKDSKLLSEFLQERIKKFKA